VGWDTRNLSSLQPTLPNAALQLPHRDREPANRNPPLTPPQLNSQHRYLHITLLHHYINGTLNLNTLLLTTIINSGRLFRPTLSFFLGSVCNITVAAFVHSDAFSGTCHRQKGAAPPGSLNRALLINHPTIFTIKTSY